MSSLSCFLSSGCTRAGCQNRGVGSKHGPTWWMKTDFAVIHAWRSEKICVNLRNLRTPLLPLREFILERITRRRGVRGGEMEGCNCPDEIDPQRIGKGRVRRFRRWTQIFCFRPLATAQPPQTPQVEQKWTGGTNCRESSSLCLCGSVRTLPFPRDSHADSAKNVSKGC